MHPRRFKHWRFVCHTTCEFTPSRTKYSYTVLIQTAIVQDRHPSSSKQDRRRPNLGTGTFFFFSFARSLARLSAPKLISKAPVSPDLGVWERQDEVSTSCFATLIGANKVPNWELKATLCVVIKVQLQFRFAQFFLSPTSWLSDFWDVETKMFVDCTWTCVLVIVLLFLLRLLLLLSYGV